MRSDPDAWHMSWQEQVGSAVFFYVLIPSLVLMGIWLIVQNTKRDADEAREYRIVNVRNWFFANHYYFGRDNDEGERLREKMLKARAK